MSGHRDHRARGVIRLDALRRALWLKLFFTYVKTTVFVFDSLLLFVNIRVHSWPDFFLRANLTKWQIDRYVPSP